MKKNISAKCVAVCMAATAIMLTSCSTTKNIQEGDQLFIGLER